MLPFMKGEIMNLDYVVCPHCGCRCEDDEYCAACGNLFHDDPIPSRDVSILGALGSGLRSVIDKLDPPDTSEDYSDDSGFAHLPGNSYHYIWRHKYK